MHGGELQIRSEAGVFVRSFVAVLLLSKGGLQFGAVMVSVVEYLVRRGDVSVGATVGNRNQGSLPVVRHQDFSKGTCQGKRCVCKI